MKVAQAFTNKYVTAIDTGRMIISIRVPYFRKPFVFDNEAQKISLRTLAMFTLVDVL
jgi:hypothetical protein